MPRLGCYRERARLPLELERRAKATARCAGGRTDSMLQPADIGDAVVQFARDDTLAGRIMLYYEPGMKRLIPTDMDLFELSEEI